MQLTPGTKLAEYEILASIGAGGMGEVYRARDTKLGREVAIKVLPAAFAEDRERLARFEREARLLASLNHPNIATIHDLEVSDGVHFLVLEFVPGETLAERIKRGPIPVDEALPLFKQIAEGLEAAHEKGVIHRDLKPANVKVTPDGGIKILDFGLAKAMAGEAPDQGLSESPTMTRGATEAGILLGTAPYMSPEQARGKAVDKRTDIWAFGCCLYEALTGKTAFMGETVSDTLARTLEREPIWDALPETTPSPIRRALRRCLQKETEGRLHDIADARIEIQETMARPFDAAEAGSRPAPVPQPTWRGVLPWGVAAVALMIAAIVWMGRPSVDIDGASRTPTRLSIVLASDQRVAMDMDNLLMAFTRDGQRLAWIGSGAPERRIYTRSLDDLAVRPISGTEGVDNSVVFFSPDGRWVAFRRDGALWKVSAEGGVATKLFQSESGNQIWSGDWGDDGAIVVSLAHSGLSRIPASGGEPESLTNLNRERSEVAHERPQVLPGHRAVLFAVGIGNFNDEHVEVLDLATRKRRVVIENAFRAQYVATGHLVFGRGETLFAVAFDLERLEVIGPETPVLPNVQTDILDGRVTELTVSRNGTLAYIPGGQGFGEKRLAWVTRQGGTEFLAAPPGMYSVAKLSPDATQLAVDFNKGHVRHVALYDLSRDVLSQFTFEGSGNDNPVWSPDGSRIAFSSNRAGQWNLFAKPVGGDTPAVHIQQSTNIQVPQSWSPDGSLLAYYERSATDNFDLWLLPIDESSLQPIPFVVSEFNEHSASFSPNGGWIAYVSAEEGQPEVYIREVVRDRMGSGLKRKVSREGGWEPKWSRDGRELFYRSRDGGRLLSVSIRIEPELAIGEEKVVLEGLQLAAPETFSLRQYDVSPDGERFLMVLDGETPKTMELVVVQNWGEELKRLVPTN